MLEAELALGNFTIVTASQGYGTAFTGWGYGKLVPGQSMHYPHISLLASHDYHLVVRYSFLDGCEASSESKLVLRIDSQSKNDTLQIEIPVAELTSGVGQAWMIQGTVGLLSDTVYNLTLWFDAPVNDSCSILIDSLLAIPNINQTRVYSKAGDTVRMELSGCLENRTALSLVKQESAECERLVFSASTEIYNGTLGKRLGFFHSFQMVFFFQ